MTRFDHLEIGPASNQPGHAGRRDGTERDEKHWLGRADHERRIGQHENALRFYSRALEIDKSVVQGWVGQVQMLVALDEYPEAELWSRKALELFPANPELMSGRAQALCRVGDVSQAQKLSDGALRQEGHSAYRWMVRGELLLADRQDVDRHCFDKAVQIDRDWLVPLEIALIYLHYGNAGKALLRARQAVDVAPQSIYCWYVQARCEWQLGLDRAARQSLRHCLELSPNYDAARRLLAEVEQGGAWLRRALRRLLGRR